MERYIANEEDKYVVLIEVDGTVSVKEIASVQDAFDAAAPMIGCKWLERFIVSRWRNFEISALCNEDGYAEWGLDPKKVNKIASYLYEGYYTKHFVLGNIVLVISAEGEEGGEFYGMPKDIAEMTATVIREIAPKAEDAIKVGDTIPEPQVSIHSFETKDELVAFLHGGRSPAKNSKEETSENKSGEN